MQSNVSSSTFAWSHSRAASHCSGEGGIGPGFALTRYFISASCRRLRMTSPSIPPPRIRAMVDYLDVADRAWPVLGPLMRAHAAVYRATNGKIGGSRLFGLPSLLLLDHVGAKSGKRRTTPLAY